MKILLGGGEIAGQIYDFADGFRRLGHETFTVVPKPNPFFADHTYDLVAGYDQLAGQVPHFIQTFDLFFFQFGMSLMPKHLDFHRIRAANKLIISLFNGDDIRHASAYRQQYGINTEALGEHYRTDPLMRPLHRLRMAEWYSDLIVSVPNQSGLALRPYQHFFYPLVLERYPCAIPARDVPVVVHAPSQTSAKGTERILQAFARLKDRGIAFELRLLQDVPNQTVLDELHDADAAVDQIYFPFGKFGAEAMALGCAVATAHRPDIEPLAAHRPVCAVNEETLEDQLAELLINKRLRLDLAEKGRKHVERYHDHLAIASRLIEACLAARRGKLDYDYYPEFFAREYTIPDDQAVPAHLKRLSAMVAQKWGLPEGISPRDLVSKGMASWDGFDLSRSSPRWHERHSTLAATSGFASARPAPPSHPATWLDFRDPSLDNYLKTIALIPPAFENQAEVKAGEALARIHACFLAGELDRALVQSREASEHFPADAAIWFVRANLCFGSGQLDNAAHCYRQVTELLPAEGLPYFYRALIHVHLGNHQEAFTSFAKAAQLLPHQRAELFWGSEPSPDHTHWSQALREGGWQSRAVMSTSDRSISQGNDSDLYFKDLLPSWIPSQHLPLLGPYFAFLYAILNANVVHSSIAGGPLGKTPLAHREAELLRVAGIWTIMISCGTGISSRAHHWTQPADCLVTDNLAKEEEGVNGLDVLVPTAIVINTSQWPQKSSYSQADGRQDTVRVLHAPTHEGLQGTELILRAIDELRREGLAVDLALAEQVKDSRIKGLIQEVDILVDRCTTVGYSRCGIEGMASGLPVLSNLAHEEYAAALRKHSYLDECPILSTPPERMKEHLRILATNPELRRELGHAGR